jgi:Uma2 family endonuclease
MAVAPLQESVMDQTHLLPLTVQQYHDMLAAGILEDGAPYELLDGCLVRKDRSATGEDPMTVSHAHALVVTRLADLSARFKRFGCHLRVQQPVTLPPHHEPEPDGAIVMGTVEHYATRHPGPKDIRCLIEVSDASLRHDRGIKQRIYANAGIPSYVIINLLDDVVEVYTQPMRGKGRYGARATLMRGQQVAFSAGEARQVTIPVRRLLP